jgi:hypothetical protein
MCNLYKNCPVFFGSAKIGVSLFLPNIFLDLVFWRVLGAFGHFYLRFSFVTGRIHITTATSYKSQKSKHLQVKQKLGRGDPVGSKLFFVGALMFVMLRHTCLFRFAKIRGQVYITRIDIHLSTGI